VKLTDLEPRWFSFDDQRAGLTFLCPHCRATRIGAKVVAIPTRAQMIIFARDFPGNAGAIVPMKPEFRWTVSGTGFGDLTITPSIDASESGHWHGLIRDGEIVGGVQR
jgi:hypothetical protein